MVSLSFLHKSRIQILLFNVSRILRFCGSDDQPLNPSSHSATARISSVYSFIRAFPPFHQRFGTFLNVETTVSRPARGKKTRLRLDIMKQNSNNSVVILQHFEGTQIGGITSKAWFPREKMDSPINLCLLALGLH